MMFALLSVAWGSDPDLEARLLGPDPVVVADTSVALAESSPADPTALWPVLVLALGAGLLFAGRKQLLEKLTGSEGGESRALDVVSRASLGQGGLAVVDVRDGDGQTRRLVIGTGPSGPRLLADLSEAFALPEDL